MRHANDNAALSGAVKLGEGEARYIHAVRKLLGLSNGILSGGGIQHEQDLVRCVGHLTAHDALHLAKLIHQSALGMQPSGGVDKHHINVARHSGFNRIERHSGWVRAMLLFDDRHISAVGPDFELLDGRCSERIASAQHHRFARLLVLMRHFADGSGLSYSVNAHHHNDVRLVGKLCRKIGGPLLLFLKHELRNLLANHAIELFRRHVLIAGHPLLDVINDVERRVYAHIACYEQLLQVIEQRRIDRVLAAYEPVELAHKAGAGFVHPLLQLFLLFVGVAIDKAVENAHGQSGRLCERNGWKQQCR